MRGAMGARAAGLGVGGGTQAQLAAAVPAFAEMAGSSHYCQETK